MSGLSSIQSMFTEHPLYIRNTAICQRKTVQKEVKILFTSGQLSRKVGQIDTALKPNRMC
jgi:hypothetical protein